MRGVTALIPEVAVDLEDLLDAADHTALQVQLRSDAQVELHVERVRMRGEWPSGRTTVQGLQHRRLDLGESTAVKRVAQSTRSEEHTSELQSRENLVCRLLLEKKNLIYT